jgi:hypothetical protein
MSVLVQPQGPSVSKNGYGVRRIGVPGCRYQQLVLASRGRDNPQARTDCSTKIWGVHCVMNICLRALPALMAGRNLTRDGVPGNSAAFPCRPFRPSGFACCGASPIVTGLAAR